MEETPKNKSEEQIRLEQELAELDASTNAAREEMRKATKALAAAEGGKSGFTDTLKKIPGKIKEHPKTAIGLAAGIAVTGAGASYLTQKPEAIWGKGETRPAKVELVSTNAAPAPGFTLSPDAHVTAEAEAAQRNRAREAELRKNIPRDIEEAKKQRAEVEEKIKELTKEEADLAQIKEKILKSLDSAASPQTPVLTPEEQQKKEKEALEKIREEFRKKSPVPKAPERAPEKKTRPKVEPEPKPKTFETGRMYETGRTYGGGRIYGGGQAAQGGYSLDRASVHPSLEARYELGKNPYKLSADMLEKIQVVYTNNLEVLFPGNLEADVWGVVKKESAFTLMNTPKEQINPLHINLVNHLKKLQKESGLEPKTQNAEEYIQQCLEKIASMDKKGRKKLLDKVKLGPK